MSWTKATIATTVVVGMALMPAAAAAQTYYPPPPIPAPTCQAKFTSKMSIARASTIGGSIDVLAPITSRASGRVGVDYHAAGRHTRFTAAINSTDGRIRFARPLPRAQALLGTGILTINYAGDADTRPQSVRLRGARNRAALRLERPRIVGNRIQASGSVTSQARGVVRLQLEYQTIACNVQILRFRGRIGNDGSWEIDEALTPQQQVEIATRIGTVHSYTLFTGYFPRRIRGEMRAFQVLGDRT